MEPTILQVLSVTPKEGRVHVTAHAEAAQASITIECWFDRPPETTERELWLEARDQVLRFLDLE